MVGFVVVWQVLALSGAFVRTMYTVLGQAASLLQDFCSIFVDSALPHVGTLERARPLSPNFRVGSAVSRIYNKDSDAKDIGLQSTL